MSHPTEFQPLNTKVDFLSLDVETANTDFASICQIGVAGFHSGNVVYESSLLVDPEDWFDFFNVEIHGIEEEHVIGAPNFSRLSSSLNELLLGNTCVIHTHFDRSAITQACAKYDTPAPACNWLDSARVARRTWESVAQKGYGLANLTRMLGIQFRHHDALEDAKAAGLIMCAAIEESGIHIAEWHKRVKQPIAGPHVTLDGNPDGPLYGEALVFTGALTIPRRQASQMAADLGCAVKTGVTKKVSILVVGDQDATKLAGHQRSSKHRKALDLILDGHPLKIIRETDFVGMLDGGK